MMPSSPWLEASEQYGATTEAQYYEGLSNKKNIIVSCMSGVGLSEEVENLIDATLSPALEVIAVDYKELHTLLTNHDRKFFSNTQLIFNHHRCCWRYRGRYRH